MKTVYVPRGESRSFDYLVTDNLVVDGHLNVVNSIKAKRITGRGVITAAEVYGDVITVDEVEATMIVCRRLLSKRIIAAEIFASESAAVSCFLSTAYVETGKLTTALSEISEVKADEVIHLPPRKRGMLLTLLLSALRSLWLRFIEPDEVYDAEYEELIEYGNANATFDAGLEPVKEQVSETVRQIMKEEAEKKQKEEDGDFELRRVVSLFKLLRDEGYTLRIEPGTPEENAPTFDYEKEELIHPAA